MKKLWIIVLLLVLALCISACAAKPAEQPEGTEDVPININGFIDEVGADGKSFRIDDLWVTVDENTLYGISDAISADGQQVSDQFWIGHIITGYTEDDLKSGKVYALRIYSNLGIVE